MNEREMLTRFIKEVIKENNGIYKWIWFPVCDDFEVEIRIQTDPDLWREKILRNEWMTNNPDWNVFIVAMYVPDDDVGFRIDEDLKFLVDKTVTIERFMKDYRGSLDVPVHFHCIHVLGDDGAVYENLEEPEGPFECLNIDEEWEPNVPEDERDMAYYKEIADSIII